MLQNKKQQETLIKRNTLSIQQRLNILKKLKNGHSIQALAEEYSVHRTTISRVKNSEEKILHNDLILKSCDGNHEKKKRFQGAETSLLDQSLYKWFQQRRAMNLPITGAIIKKKALFFNQKLSGSTKFKASEDWLSRFKRRHGIRNLVMPGQKASVPADIPVSENFKIKLLNLIKSTGFSLDHIYNCDETGLYWNMLLNHSLAGKSEKGFADILSKNVDEWLYEDSEINEETGRKALTDEEIIEDVINENPKNTVFQLDNKDINEDVDNSVLLNKNLSPVSVTEAFQAINLLKSFYQSNEDEESVRLLPILQQCHHHIERKFHPSFN